MAAVRVFLSYSHDSPDHRRRVLALAERLRADGIDAMVDQYLEPGGPPEGWPRWTESQLRTADFVLAVCSPTYRSRVEGDGDPGEGHGVAWEGRLIYQHIYNAASENRKFVPVLLGESTHGDIPLPLQGVSSHRADDPQGYEALYRTITGAPATLKTALGSTRAVKSGKPSRVHRALRFRLAAIVVILAAILGGLWFLTRMPPEYTLLVTVSDPSGNPAPQAQVTASLPATYLRSASSWRIGITASVVPQDRKVVIHAEDASSFLTGEQVVSLGRAATLAAAIRLTARSDAAVTGIVVDGAQRAVSGARVSIVGQSEAALTDANGSFTLPAHAAPSQMVQLRVEKDGYKPMLQEHPAGGAAAIVVIER
jgi:hypothetical protein